MSYVELSKPTSTRILELYSKRKDHNGHLRGKLIEIDLKTPPKFDTISYVWGKRKDIGIVYCDTPSGELEEVRLTGNSEDVLRRMQHPTKSRLLWIDAVCINQRNVSERNHQVSIMTKVSSTASCVLVWLPSDENIDFCDPTNLRRTLRRYHFVYWFHQAFSWVSNFITRRLLPGWYRSPPRNLRNVHFTR